MSAPDQPNTPAAGAISWSRPPAACSRPGWWAWPSPRCRSTTGSAAPPALPARRSWRRPRPASVLDRKIIVRFDANVAGGLPWRFVPEQSFVEVRVGDVLTVNYIVVNESARETVGNATYNVSPPTVGAYFSQDQLLLLHRAAPEARREARDAGRVLHRSEARRRMPSTTISTPSRCPTPCIGCARASRRRVGSAGASPRTHELN